MTLPEFEQLPRCESRACLSSDSTIQCAKPPGHGSAMDDYPWLHQNGNKFWSDGDDVASGGDEPDVPVNRESDAEVLLWLAEDPDSPISNVSRDCLRSIADDLKPEKPTIDERVFDLFRSRDASDALTGALCYRDALTWEIEALLEETSEEKVPRPSLHLEGVRHGYRQVLSIMKNERSVR